MCSLHDDKIAFELFAFKQPRGPRQQEALKHSRRWLLVKFHCHCTPLDYQGVAKRGQASADSFMAGFHSCRPGPQQPRPLELARMYSWGQKTITELCGV